MHFCEEYPIYMFHYRKGKLFLNIARYGQNQGQLLRLNAITQLIQFHAFSPIKGYDFSPGICDKEYLFWCIFKYLYINAITITTVTTCRNMFKSYQHKATVYMELISSLLVQLKPDPIRGQHMITMAQVDVLMIRGQWFEKKTWRKRIMSLSLEEK